MARPLDKEWLGWLRTNVDRGCSKQELTQILLKAGFDAAAVRGAFDEVRRQARSPAMPAAKPSIDVPGAKRFESSSIELYTAEGFLAAAECAKLVALIRSRLRPSTISSPPSGEADRQFRTSRTCDLIGESGAVARLDARLCQAMGIDRSLAEPSQGQCYEVGQEFKPHTDFFKAYELETFSTPAWGQRTWTFMIYLNEPEGGGATRFVDIDLTIQPKAGMAVFWNNLLPTGEPNNFTRHQGMPVTAGSKLIITKWFRMAPAAGPAFSSIPVSWTQKVRAS